MLAEIDRLVADGIGRQPDPRPSRVAASGRSSSAVVGAPAARRSPATGRGWALCRGRAGSGASRALAASAAERRSPPVGRRRAPARRRRPGSHGRRTPARRARHAARRLPCARVASPPADRVPRRRPRAGAPLLGGVARHGARAARAGRGRGLAEPRRRGRRRRPRARARARATASRSPTSRSTTSRPRSSGSSRSAARSSTRASAGRSAATPRAAPSASGPPQPAEDRGARRSALSSTSVTGPSFSRLTAIAAPKRPRSTGTPSAATAAA